jgi:hypothetical protein
MSLPIRAWSRTVVLAASGWVLLAACHDTGDNTAIGSPGSDGGDATMSDDGAPSSDGNGGADVTVETGPSTADATSDSAVDASLDGGAHDAAGDVGAESGGDSGGDAATDAAGGAGSDGSSDAPAEASSVDAADAAPPDGGCAPTDWACQCNAYVTANESGNTATTGVCNQTELTVYMVDANTTNAGACLDCLLNGGQGLDNPALGVSKRDCEDPFTGAGAGETTAECLATLACDLGVTPSSAPADAGGAPGAPAYGGAIAGYCGTTLVATCEGSGPQSGACATQITAGFPSTFTPSQIGASIGIATYASGRAGLIITHAHNNGATGCITQCLSGSTL